MAADFKRRWISLSGWRTPVLRTSLEPVPDEFGCAERMSEDCRREASGSGDSGCRASFLADGERFVEGGLTVRSWPSKFGLAGGVQDYGLVICENVFMGHDGGSITLDASGP